MHQIALLAIMLLASTHKATVLNDTGAWLRVSSEGENVVHCISPKSRLEFTGAVMKTLYFEFMSESGCKGTRIQYAYRVGPGGGVVGSYTAWGTPPYYHVDSHSGGGAVM